MTPEADRIHTRLLRLDWAGHREDNCKTAIEAAQLIHAQEAAITQLRADLMREHQRVEHMRASIEHMLASIHDLYLSVRKGQE